MHRRVAFSFGLAIAVLLVSLVPVAAEGAPERFPLEADDLLFAPGEVCDFGVSQEILINQEYALAFPVAQDGSQLLLVTGRLTLRLTNLASGESITVNASGPGKLVFNEDGSLSIMAMGRTSFWFAPGDLDGPSLRLTAGLAIVVIGPAGSETYAVLPRRDQDLCAALS
jgi:hypothetical protein